MTYLEIGQLQPAWSEVNESLRLNPRSELGPSVKAEIQRAMQASGIRP